jgi:hypothetical protein
MIADPIDHDRDPEVSHAELMGWLRPDVPCRCVHPMVRLFDQWALSGCGAMIFFESYVCLACDIVITACGPCLAETYSFRANLPKPRRKRPPCP